MPRSQSSTFRSIAMWGTAGAGAALIGVLLRGPLAPDPYASFFFKAQQLEARGLTDLALKHYKLLSEDHPESVYAPASLEAQANLLVGMGRKTGDRTLLQEAMTLYQRLANTYANDRASGKALLAAGDIAANDLRDPATARSIFGEVLTQFPNNEFYASQATLKLGRLALDEGKKEEARDTLQKVLQHYPSFTETCAEAQYHLGVLFETHFKNKTWAENAYRATIERYGKTVWAANARERLGLLIYQMSSERHPARLVLLQTQPLPDDTGEKDNFARGTLTAALRPILAARGLDADVTTLRGWSLEPFWAGFDPGHPSRVPTSPLSLFNNIADSAGLLYDRRQDAGPVAALQTLQKELDAARPTVIYTGQWQLVVGYDSEQQQVFVQNRGARVQALSIKELQDSWKAKAPDGGAFTLLSFFAPGERERVRRLPGNTAEAVVKRIGEDDKKPLVVGPGPAPEPTPTPTQPPLLGLRPMFVFELKPLSEADAHKRALRRAAALMVRARDGDVLLNISALNALANELDRLSTSPVTSPEPVVESPVPQPEETAPPPEGELSGDVPLANATPTATPTRAPEVSATPVNGARKLARTQVLLGWFKAPLQQWIRSRRDAAAYLDVAASALRRPQLKGAANDLRESVAALARAASALPSEKNLAQNGALSPAARRALAEAAKQVRAARDAEKRATEAIQNL